MTRSRLLVLAAMVAGLTVRLYGIDRDSLWIDECHSLSTAEGPPGELLARMAARRETHPPLYFLALSVWTEGFGDGDAAVRVPSALASVAAIPFAALLADALAPGAGVAAAWLAALAPGLLAYGQEARMYALLTLLASIVLWLWLAEPEGAPARVALVAGMTLALYTHLVGLFLGAALGLLALLRPAPTTRTRVWRVLPFAAALALYVPWLVALSRQWGTTKEDFGWNVVRDLPVQMLRVVPHSLLGDAGRASVSGRTAQLLVVAVLAVALAALVSRTSSRGRAILLALAIALPVLQVGLFSYVTSPFFHRRYFSFLGLPLVALLAAGLAVLPRRAGGAGLVLLLVCFGVRDVQRLQVREHVDIRAVVAELAQWLPTGETVYHFAPGGLPQETYLLARHYRPEWRQCMVAWRGRAYSRETEGYVGGACVVPDLATAASGKDRLFLVVSGLPERPLSSGAGASPATDLLAAEIPVGFRVSRALELHLCRVVELER